MKKVKKTLLDFAGRTLLPFAIDVLFKTVKIRYENKEEFLKFIDAGENVVVAFWHGKMAAGWYSNKGKNFSALASQSKDGEILTGILKRWKYNVVRGSSRRGGKESLENMIELVNKNNSIAITPDGPTGPAKVMKPGAVVLAKKTKRPLFLLGVGYKKKIQFKSWDSFELPKPFSEAVVKYSPAYFIDAELNFEETDKLIKEYGVKLEELNKEAEANA
ncbi:MAG: lysophospholipid acyltransferase family protein [Chlorobi bacterium]|nr:lysophospholipid acyltransferase family protein [Chlorobiota bacterium]